MPLAASVKVTVALPTFDVFRYRLNPATNNAIEKWQDIDWEKRSWRIPKTKSGKVRHVPLSTGAVDVLEILKTRLLEGYLDYAHVHKNIQEASLMPIFMHFKTGKPFVSFFTVGKLLVFWRACQIFGCTTYAIASPRSWSMKVEASTRFKKFWGMLTSQPPAAMRILAASA